MVMSQVFMQVLGHQMSTLVVIKPGYELDFYAGFAGRYGRVWL